MLIVHMGREFLFDPCGRGMTVVSPTAADLASYLPIWLPANLDRLILAMGPCLEQPAGTVVGKIGPKFQLLLIVTFLFGIEMMNIILASNK